MPNEVIAVVTATSLGVNQLDTVNVRKHAERRCHVPRHVLFKVNQPDVRKRAHWNNAYRLNMGWHALFGVNQSGVVNRDVTVSGKGLTAMCTLRKHNEQTLVLLTVSRNPNRQRMIIKKTTKRC